MKKCWNSIVYAGTGRLFSGAYPARRNFRISGKEICSFSTPVRLPAKRKHL
jgi:hypothetical protein